MVSVKNNYKIFTITIIIVSVWKSS